MQQAQANAAAPAMSPVLDTGASAAPAATTAPQAGTEQAAQATGEAAATTLSSIADITPAVRQAADPGFFASIKDFFATGNIDSLKQAFLPGTQPEVILGKLKAAGYNVTPEVASQMAEALAPGMLRSYGPTIGLGLGVMGLTGGFEAPAMGDVPDAYGGMTGSKLLQMYPQQYGLAQPGSQYKPIGAANGGGIDSFPRKNGAIYGPGTETSDDVPAMLSDGEFVMTAQAVRGAGNGSRELGMRRMYDMMRKFEGGAVRG
jgi:hypothetical protein